MNIGYKSDGIIPASEFRYNPELKVGDKVEVYVENQEDKGGQLILSHKKARLQKSWENINKALEDDAVIQGYIKSRTKGGMIVDVFGIEAIPFQVAKLTFTQYATTICLWAKQWNSK